jgi:hypothetical protein
MVNSRVSSAAPVAAFSTCSIYKCSLRYIRTWAPGSNHRAYVVKLKTFGFASRSKSL